MIKKLGFMQGRLLDSEKKNAIQYFPDKNWTSEFKLAKKNKFKIIEWTVNKENLKKNPIYNGELDQLIKLMKEYNIKIPSITNYYFRQKPFFKKKNLKEKKKIIQKLEKIILNGNQIGII